MNVTTTSESTPPTTTDDALEFDDADDNDVHSHNEKFRRKMSVIGGFTSFSPQDFNQLTALFSTLKNEVSTSKNEKLINALEGIGNILETTEKEHKQLVNKHGNDLNIDAINFQRKMANLSMYDLGNILDIVEHGDRPQEQKSDKLRVILILFIL